MPEATPSVTTTPKSPPAIAPDAPALPATSEPTTKPVSSAPGPPRSLADLVDPPASGGNPSTGTNSQAGAADLPPEEALEQARLQVIEVLGEEARQAAKPDQKTALGRKMLGLAKDTTGNPAVKYILMDNARKMFIAGGDVEMAVKTASAIGKEFKVDVDVLKSATFSALADGNLTTEVREPLAKLLLADLDEALAEQKFSLADEYSVLATKVASRSKDIELKKSIALRRNQLQAINKQLKAFEAAAVVLAADASNPAANLVAGKFKCFVLEDWAAGADHLLKSGNQVYLAAAKAETRLSKGEMDAALPAAEAWYDLAENMKKDDKDTSAAALGRAKDLYEQVLPSQSGLEKIRIEKRLAELEAKPEVVAARVPRKKFFPGLVARQYPKHPSQLDGNLYTGWVPLEELGKPIGPAVVIGSLTPLKYHAERNCVAAGYLKIEAAGDYSFNADAGHDRVALYINGEPICPFRDGESRIATVALEKGMASIMVVSMVVPDGQCRIKWQPPGTTLLTPIPATIMFHTRD